jgi:hypothetical protein
MDKTRKYVNFPIPMLKGLHINSKKFLDNAYEVGIYSYSLTLHGPEEKRYSDALRFFGIRISDFSIRLNKVKDLFYTIPIGSPYVGIERDIVYDYYNNEKSEFDIICLSAFLCIRSILGTKSYCKTNKYLIHARMLGYSTPKDLPSNLTPLEEKYKIRWHMDKVMQELQTDWYLKTISNHQRGMYVSFDLSLDELAAKSEMNKQFTKAKKLKALKKEAIQKAKTQLTSH